MLVVNSNIPEEELTIEYAGLKQTKVKAQKTHSKIPLNTQQYPNITFNEIPGTQDRITALEEHDQNGTIDGGIIF